MRATFVHTADNHLGYEQYGVKERFNDFARAFHAVVDDAIARQVDLFVVAGDLFNKRAIDALTLIHAQEALQKLRDAGIQAVAIEGNHDRSYYRDGISWLEFLSWEGLLVLLNPRMEGGAPVLQAWNKQDMRGAYVDVERGGERLRVYGIPWFGASTGRVMEALGEQLRAARASEEAEGVRYRLLLLHTGVEGMVPNMHGLPTREQFEPLRGLVDYVALGHVHKPYCIDEWLHNPGSTETWGAEESAWDRGYYFTRIDTSVPEGTPKHIAEHIINPRRPFIRLAFKVDGLTTPTSLYEHFERFCTAQAREHTDGSKPEPGQEPVVDVGLLGVLGFDAGALEKARLEECVKRHFGSLVERIHDSTRDTDYEPDEDEAGDGRDRSTWQQLELRIFADLIGRDARFEAQAPRWAQLLAELKQMALSGEDPASVTLRLREAHKLLSLAPDAVPDPVPAPVTE